ncbi:unnamed protein product [Brachionus calyciflorus]|uniref:DnaJ-like protein C11 C-terminal domain-containing protein n=1 Tax=Brachionus calyciflorus TaxID=104777 RepID=A0A813ZS88_9BILA|nr:unnamed protein product [Brachionus calyciflorus]
MLPSLLKLKTTLGSHPGFSANIYKRLTQKCNGSLNGIFRYKNGSLAPIAIGTINYQLDTHLIGQLQYKTSLNFASSHMSTALVYEKENLSANVRFQLGLKNTFVAAQVARKFLDLDLKLKSSVQYGFLGFTFSYGIEKQITQFSKVDASMVINTLAGVALHIELERGLQKFVVPIHLSREVVPSAIFYGTVTPVICFYVVKKMLIDPYIRDKEEKEAQIKQERLRSELLERKRLALAAQNLMKETVTRNIEKEGPNGLVITRALYGKLRDEDKDGTRNVLENEKLVDVTIPLQFLVKDHTLQILNDQPKSNLEGFYDPCIGETKVLFIQYKYNGEPYETTLTDDQIIRLPKASHKTQWWSRPFSAVRS